MGHVLRKAVTEKTMYVDVQSILRYFWSKVSKTKSTAWWLQTRQSCDARPARGQIIWTDWNSTWAYLERVREIGIMWNYYELKNMLVYFVHSSNHFRNLKKSLDMFSRRFGCHCFPCPWKPVSNTIKQHLQCEEHVVGFSFSPDGLLLGNSMHPKSNSAVKSSMITPRSLSDTRCSSSDSCLQKVSYLFGARGLQEFDSFH